MYKSLYYYVFPVHTEVTFTEEKRNVHVAWKGSLMAWHQIKFLHFCKLFL